MTRDDGGYWLPVHPGLLRDERWADLSTELRGSWITLYLLLDAEPRRGWFRDRGRVVWLLQQYGGGRGLIRARRQVDLLEAAGWLEPESPDSPALTLRRWHEYAARGVKAIWNKERGDRGDRSAEYARTAERKREQRRRSGGGDGGRRREQKGDLDKTRRDDETTSRLDAGADAPTRDGWPSFEEMMANQRNEA